jgi:8-oxo-dGTP pyrophosphatase MutT (NUDIX family)
MLILISLQFGGFLFAILNRMRTIKRDIAGAVIFSNDNHVLLGKNVKGGVYEDLWVIPGGGIDAGETKEQAVVREILEEVGIDITNASKVLLSEVQTGITEKTLRDTGERVIVEMTFYNFKVDIDLPSFEINIKLEDDFGHAEWVPFDRISAKKYSPSVEGILKGLKLL